MDQKDALKSSGDSSTSRQGPASPRAESSSASAPQSAPSPLETGDDINGSDGFAPAAVDQGHEVAVNDAVLQPSPPPQQQQHNASHSSLNTVVKISSWASRAKARAASDEALPDKKSLRSMQVASSCRLVSCCIKPLMRREQALQEAERLKREEVRRKREEEEREERQRLQLAADEAQRIAATQLPVQLDALMEEGSGKGDGLTFVKKVSGRMMMSMTTTTTSAVFFQPSSSSLQVRAPLMTLSGVPGGGSNDVAQVLLLRPLFSLLIFRSSPGVAASKQVGQHPATGRQLPVRPCIFLH
jgi:hypothetical protein